MLQIAGIIFILLIVFALIGWIMELTEEHDVTYYDKNGNKTGSKKYKKKH